jgi:hypothetical protein
VNGHRRSGWMGLLLLAIGGLTGDASTSQSNAAARHRIVGAWRLESRNIRNADGQVLPDPVLGTEPSGRLFYDASGNMMLQMMRQQRERAISSPPDATAAKNPRIVLGYDAYFGTFRVNEAAGTVTHHVEGSLFPEDLGKDFTRAFTLEGDTLTLSFSGRSVDGLELTRTLRFERSMP